MIDVDGKVWSLQYINERGEKVFVRSRAIKEHFIPIHHQPDQYRKILICEGFATGATLAEMYPAYCVIAACNSGNLKPVALHIRENIPCAEITICADDDRMRSDNPGLVKGREAAIASGAFI